MGLGGRLCVRAELQLAVVCGVQQGPPSAKTGAGVGPLALPHWGLLGPPAHSAQHGLPTPVCPLSAIRVHLPDCRVVVGLNWVNITGGVHNLKLPSPKVLMKGVGGGAFSSPPDLSLWGSQAVSLRTFFRTGRKTMNSWRTITPTSSGEWAGLLRRGLRPRPDWILAPPLQGSALTDQAHCPLFPVPGSAGEGQLRGDRVLVLQLGTASAAGV